MEKHKLVKKRSLYQCLNAKYPIEGKMIRCSKGHDFPMGTSIKAAGRGAPLELYCCQNCLDYDEMGPPIPTSERGWFNLAR